MAYDALSAAYDALMRDVSYEDVLKFWQAALQRRGLAPKTVLDLACGTGSFTLLLARAGYEVLGADLSEEMLTVAASKCADEENAPFFICQPMQELRLPRRWNSCLCSRCRRRARCRRTVSDRLPFLPSWLPSSAW